MPNLTKPGDFIAMIGDYSIKEYDSGAVAIVAQFQILKRWVKIGEEWLWEDFDRGEHIDGYFFIIKKDGTISEKKQQMLMSATGWDGHVESIIDKIWEPWLCRISIEPKIDQKGNQRLEVNWINHGDTTPGSGIQALTPESATSIKARFGSQMRASAAAIQKELGQERQARQAETQNEEIPKDEVPF